MIYVLVCTQNGLELAMFKLWWISYTRSSVSSFNLMRYIDRILKWTQVSKLYRDLQCSNYMYMYIKDFTYFCGLKLFICIFLTFPFHIFTGETSEHIDELSGNTVANVLGDMLVFLRRIVLSDKVKLQLCNSKWTTLLLQLVACQTISGGSYNSYKDPIFNQIPDFFKNKEQFNGLKSWSGFLLFFKQYWYLKL